MKNVSMFGRAFLKIAAVVICVLCVIVFLERGRSDARSGSLSGPHADMTRLERKIHSLINKERAKKGLPALLWDEGLHSIARRHSQDMEKRNFFSHDDPEGRSFPERYKDAFYKCRIRVGDTFCTGAENISQFYLDNESLNKDGSAEEKIAEAVVKGWMNSKGHRGNILTPYFKRQGIGVAVSDDGRVFVTENFC